MGRFCYCSAVQPDKSDVVRQHWKTKKKETPEEEERFWKNLQMTGFESWLQPSPQGDLMVHCLEGVSLEGIFKGLREEIKAGNNIALSLQAFYQNVLNKDYKSPEVEPSIECLLDIELPKTAGKMVKKGFVYPLLPHMEQAHRKFRQESNHAKKERHQASLQAFGVFRLTSWLQTTPQGKTIVCYTEREDRVETASQRIARGLNSSAWQEIAKELMAHTGLSAEALSPQVEWLHCSLTPL